MHHRLCESVRDIIALQELEVHPIGTIEHVYAMAHMALGESRALKVLPRGEWEEYDVTYPRR